MAQVLSIQTASGTSWAPYMRLPTPYHQSMLLASRPVSMQHYVPWCLDAPELPLMMALSRSKMWSAGTSFTCLGLPAWLCASATITTMLGAACIAAMWLSLNSYCDTVPPALQTCTTRLSSCKLGQEAADASTCTDTFHVTQCLTVVHQTSSARFMRMQAALKTLKGVNVASELEHRLVSGAISKQM